MESIVEADEAEAVTDGRFRRRGRCLRRTRGPGSIPTIAAVAVETRVPASGQTAGDRAVDRREYLEESLQDHFSAPFFRFYSPPPTDRCQPADPQRATGHPKRLVEEVETLQAAKKQRNQESKFLFPRRVETQFPSVQYILACYPRISRGNPGSCSCTLHCVLTHALALLSQRGRSDLPTWLGL